MSKSRSMKPAAKAATSALALSVMMGAGTLPAVADTHTVARGDTLSGIAVKHGVSLDSLFKANGMGMNSVIYPGQKITYGTESNPAQQATAGVAVHTVVPGDTLGGIANRHGVSLDSVFKANGMGMSTVIHPGQQIKLSGGAAPAPAPVQVPAPVQAKPSAGAYTVVSGDTMGAIASRHGVSLASLLQANGMQVSEVIFVGQRIALPSGSGAPGPSSSPAQPTPAATSGAALQQLVRTTAVNMGVDPVLAQAIAYQESGFQQGVVSYAGAIGTMQVMPTSGIWASELVGRTLDLNRAEDNVTAGIAIIKALVRTSGSLEDAIASYYQGQYSVQTIGYYDDTKDYVASVKAHTARFS